MEDEAPPAFLNSIREADKLEAVVACVGFDDLLDVSLGYNLPHLDEVIVVTSMTDAKTVQVCKKHGVTVVQTDLYERHGKTFAKGAALNAGLSRCMYRGWRMVLDADILLPDNFRRILLNHTHLDPSCLYGADRTDVIGGIDVMGLMNDWGAQIVKPQWGFREEMHVPTPIRSRVITRLYGYLPLGYFQLWHALSNHEYPSSQGGASLDDVLFAQQWPVSHRRLLPSLIVYHLCPSQPVLGENWDGIRRSPRLEGV